MKVLLDENELSRGVQQLAERLNKAYEGRPLTVIGIMTVSLVGSEMCIRDSLSLCSSSPRTH